MSAERPVVAVYPDHFLAVSQTFIHRQLLGAGEGLRMVALAQVRENAALFPFEPLHVVGRGQLEDVATKVLRRLLGRSTLLGPLQARAFARILREERAGLVHAHFGPSGIHLLPVVRSLGIPLLVTFHGYDASTLLRQPSYLADLRRLFASPSTHVIAVSELMARRLQEHGAPASRTRAHYIGIPRDAFPYVERVPPAVKAARGEPLHLVQVSNFVEKKGHETTLRAFAEVARTRANLTLTLAGDGALRAPMEALARELGVAGRVAFPGKVSGTQVPELFRRADVFVHHSVTAQDGDQEGIPTVIMEAMSSGLPVVTTRHAGIPELVENGVSGLLVEERDVAAHAKAIEEALTQGPAMGLNASRRVAERFDLARQNQSLNRIYHEILGSP